MKKMNKIVAIAMLISILNFSQSHAYFSEVGWDYFKANSAAGKTTRKYYTGENKIRYECTFDNNKENGVCKEFYKNGHLAIETRSTNNGRSITYKTFFEDGKLASEDHYTDGQRSGLSKTFFENGELASEGRYTNDQKNGLFKQYYWRSASGQASSESSYKNGFRHGAFKEYSPNGTVTWSQNYN